MSAMLTLYLTREECAIVRLALKMLEHAAAAKAEYGSEGHVRSLIERLEAARSEADD